MVRWRYLLPLVGQGSICDYSGIYSIYATPAILDTSDISRWLRPCGKHDPLFARSNKRSNTDDFSKYSFLFCHLMFVHSYCTSGRGSWPGVPPELCLSPPGPSIGCCDVFTPPPPRAIRPLPASPDGGDVITLRPWRHRSANGTSITGRWTKLVAGETLSLGCLSQCPRTPIFVSRFGWRHYPRPIAQSRKVWNFEDSPRDWK